MRRTTSPAFYWKDRMSRLSPTLRYRLAWHSMSLLPIRRNSGRCRVLKVASTFAGRSAVQARLRSSILIGWSVKGPKVEPPKRRGFGTTLLEKVVTVQCDANVELHYHRDGLQFTMALPLRDTRLVPRY